MSKAAALHAWTEAIRDKAFTKTKARLDKLVVVYSKYTATKKEREEVKACFNWEEIEKQLGIKL